MTFALNKFADLEDKIESGEIDYVADKDKQIASLTTENAALHKHLKISDKAGRIIQRDMLQVFGEANQIINVRINGLWDLALMQAKKELDIE